MDKLPVTSAESIKLNLGKIRSNKILRGNKTFTVIFFFDKRPKLA